MSVTKVTGMMQTSTKGGDIPSAGTMVIDTDGDYFDISGTTGITGMTVAVGRRFTLQFDGIVTITDNAAITLSGAANFTTAAGDILSFIAVAADTVVQTGYSLVDGGSPIAPSGGAWTLIGTSVASDSATLDQTGIGTTYDTHVLVGTDLVPASDGVDSYMRVGDSGGFDSGASDYAWMLANQSGGGASFAGYNGNGTNYLKIGHAHGNAAGEGTGFVFYLHGKTSTSGTMKNIITGFWGGMGTGSGMNAGYFIGARDSAVINLDRVQFYFASGNVATGRFSVYGIKHT